MTAYAKIAVALAFLLAGFASGFSVEHWRLGIVISDMRQTQAETERQMQAVRADDERIARTTELDLSTKAIAIEQGKQNEIATINARLSAALASLRSRPERPASAGQLSSAAADCKGATGAELYREDAAVALGIARDADIQRAALAACYQQYDDAREMTLRK